MLESKIGNHDDHRPGYRVVQLSYAHEASAKSDRFGLERKGKDLKPEEKIILGRL